MSTKKLPNKITVMGVPFKIEFLTELKDGTEELSGLTVGVDRTIKICTTTNDTPEKLHSTIMHELSHAVLYVAGLDGLLDDKMEEAIATAIEHGLSPLYRRNF